ncbi:augmin subunit 2-like protein [Tanacetum coccineum]
MASVKGNESNLAGRKPTRKLGGMSDVLAIATDLGYSRFRPPTSQDDLNSGYDLIRLLRDLTTVQRKVAELHVELQGRRYEGRSLDACERNGKEDRNVSKDHYYIERFYPE